MRSKELHYYQPSCNIFSGKSRIPLAKHEAFFPPREEVPLTPKANPYSRGIEPLPVPRNLLAIKIHLGPNLQKRT